jgi:molybdate transport system substrate-binding protein
MSIPINVLSAGAVQPGLVKVIEAFRRESGHDVEITFATAPAIRARLAAGEPADVVIAPPDVLDESAEAGKVGDRVTIGRIGVGVMVRAGVPLPKIATVDELKQSLIRAESVVYNQASTGIYLDRLFERLGIGEEVGTKTTRYPDAAAVLDHISKGAGREIGFGAITVIIEGGKKGLKLVGPLPPDVQNYTTYAATTLVGGPGDGARELVRYLTLPAAKALFAAAGID